MAPGSPLRQAARAFFLTGAGGSPRGDSVRPFLCLARLVATIQGEIPYLAQDEKLARTPQTGRGRPLAEL
jgi:hypothetical protein